MTRLFLMALFLLASPWLSANDDELLEPEKAFRFTAEMVAPDLIEGHFQVAKGYYLYKNKISFTAQDAKLGKADLPAGKTKVDEIFGKVDVYLQDFRVRIPVKGASKPFTLKASYQGCAEVGVCYPPIESTIKLQPAAADKTASVDRAKPATPVKAEAGAAVAAPMVSTPASPNAPESQSPALIERLKQLAGADSIQAEPEFLPPEEAFKVSVSARQDGSIQANFMVTPGYYLYRDKTTLNITAPSGVQVDALQLPPADEKDDPNFGKMFVYHQSFSANSRLIGLPADSRQITVVAGFQGCSEKGICYPPMDQTLTVELGATPVASTAVVAPPENGTAAADSSDSGQIAALLEGGNFWLIVVSFFGFGLLLSLTPCVFPMIPILSGIIVGQGKAVTKRRGFVLSLAYVLGMAVTYALAGVAAGMSGTLISNALQNPWALGAGALIFVGLAFSMFGFYELQLPSFMQSRFSDASNRMKGGKLTGVFMMGALSALIVGPCVAAPLAGALLYIGQSGDLVLGGVSLFSLALGMGVPLLLVGIAGGALLPRAGAWMEAVKKFFGVMMIAIAIWLISPMLPDVLPMVLWAALLIISGVFLKAFEPMAVNASGWLRFWKGFGIMILVAGIAILLGALAGSRDLLQPLSVFKGGSAGSAQASSALDFRKVKNLAELEEAVRGAQGSYVMLDFYADWCVSCKELEKFTFSDPRVQGRLKDVVLLKADVTGNAADDKALLKRFTLFGPPGIIFFDRAGSEIGYRVIGYEPADKFLSSLEKAIP